MGTPKHPEAGGEQTGSQRQPGTMGTSTPRCPGAMGWAPPGALSLACGHNGGPGPGSRSPPPALPARPSPRNRRPRRVTGNKEPFDGGPAAAGTHGPPASPVPSRRGPPCPLGDGATPSRVENPHPCPAAGLYGFIGPCHCAWGTFGPRTGPLLRQLRPPRLVTTLHNR